MITSKTLDEQVALLSWKKWSIFNNFLVFCGLVFLFFCFFLNSPWIKKTTWNESFLKKPFFLIFGSETAITSHRIPTSLSKFHFTYTLQIYVWDSKMLLGNFFFHQNLLSSTNWRTTPKVLNYEQKYWTFSYSALWPLIIKTVSEIIYFYLLFGSLMANLGKPHSLDVNPCISSICGLKVIKSLVKRLCL